MEEEEDSIILQNWHEAFSSISMGDSVLNFSKIESKNRINLETLNSKLDSLITKNEFIEAKLDQLSSEITSINKQLEKLSDKNCIADIISFKPFYNKENYSCNDNISILNGDNLSFKIIILGDSEKIILYPFGKVQINRDYQVWSYSSELKDVQDVNLGTVYLKLTKLDGYYIFELETDYYETEKNEKFFIRDLDKPFSINFESKIY